MRKIIIVVGILSFVGINVFGAMGELGWFAGAFALLAISGVLLIVQQSEEEARREAKLIDYRLKTHLNDTLEE